MKSLNIHCACVLFVYEWIYVWKTITTKRNLLCVSTNHPHLLHPPESAPLDYILINTWVYVGWLEELVNLFFFGYTTGAILERCGIFVRCASSVCMLKCVCVYVWGLRFVRIASNVRILHRREVSETYAQVLVYSFLMMSSLLWCENERISTQIVNRRFPSG